MKRILILATLFSTPAFAQSPTVADVTATANSMVSALRQQRDEANDRVVTLSVQLEKANREIADLKDAAAKAAKPEFEKK